MGRQDIEPDLSPVDERTQVSALPVLKDEKLVGLVTEQSFMNVAKDLLEIRLRGS